jgi:hypothetical protein
MNRSQLPRCGQQVGVERNCDAILCSAPAPYIDEMSIPFDGGPIYYCHEHHGGYDTPLWCGPQAGTGKRALVAWWILQNSQDEEAAKIALAEALQGETISSEDLLRLLDSQNEENP